MPRCLFVTAGDPSHPSGGTLYNQQLIGALERAGITVIQQALPRHRFLPTPAAWRALGGLIARLEPLPIVIDSVALGSALLITARSSCPLILLMHYQPSRYPGFRGWERWLWAGVERLVFRRACRIVAMSAAARRDLQAAGARANQTIVVPPGRAEDLPALSDDRWPDRPARFLNVAHWLPAKGVDTLVRAFDLLDAPGASLTLVGSQEVDPPYARAVRRLIAASPNLERIQAPGVLRPGQVSGLAVAADVFVFPSRAETFGMAVLEAMSAGCAVVASQLAPLAELIDPGTTGYLVPPGSITGFAERMRQLAADRQHRARLGRAARARIEAHPTWRATLGNLVAQIQALGA